MRTLDNGHLIFKYASTLDCLPLRQKSASASDASAASSITINVKGNCHGEAVLFIEENGNSQQDLQSFRIQTSARRCIVVTDDKHQDSLRRAMVKHPKTAQQATDKGLSDETPTQFKNQQDVASIGNRSVETIVDFMYPEQWYAQQILKYKASIVELILNKSYPTGTQSLADISQLVARFLTPKVTLVSLDMFDRNTNEVLYCSKANGGPGLYKIKLPEDGALDLRNIQNPEDPSNCLRVTSMMDFALEDCVGLTSVVIPNGVASINAYLFLGCSSLTSVVIPGSVTSIGDYAFYLCTSLTSIEIPESVTSVGSYAFNGCNSLRSVTCTRDFYARIKTDLRDIFGRNLSNINFISPDGILLKAASSADLVMPEDVTSIGDCAFNGCSSLPSITCTRDFYNDNKSRLRSVYGRTLSKTTFLDPEGGLIKRPYTAGVSASTSAAALLSFSAVAIGCCMMSFGAITALIIATAVVGGLAVTSVGVASGLGIMSHIATQKAKAMQAPVA